MYSSSGLQVYVGDRVVPAEQATVSVFDAGFQSGDAVWEGLRVYHGTVFRLAEHLHRLEHSARALRIDLPRSLDEIADAVRQTLEANGLRHDCHVRLMVTRGRRRTSGMDPRTSPPAGLLVIVAESKPVPAEPAPQRLRVSSIRRPGPQVLDPGIHHANQLNSILARLEVQDLGVDAALMLDTDGFAAEADTANVFCVTGGRVRTPAPTACLHGVTRAIVADEARALGYPVSEERLSGFDLYAADEVFLTGTICELVPVTEIDGRVIRDGTPGPVYESLLAAYRRRVDAETRHER